MNDLYKRKVNKIYKKLISLSSKGKDNILEYYKYLDEIVDKGDYSVLEQVINIYFKIDISKYQSIEKFRDKVWNEICLETKLPILEKINKLYKSKNIYQIGNYIYKEDEEGRDDDGRVLPVGFIIEDEKVTTEDVNYLVKNKMYARLIGEKLPFLKVKRFSDDKQEVIDEYNFDINPVQNQLNQYKMAIDFILE